MATRAPTRTGHAATEPCAVGAAAELAPWLGGRRAELTSHCRRLLGSSSEAEDAVQETLVRAWKNIHRFEQRSTVRTWLYSIATNVCRDMRASPQRRARPQEPSPASTASEEAAVVTGDLAPPERVYDGRWTPEASDPAEAAARREIVQDALVATLELLPPRQRAVLILRDVLRWRAIEAADLLETTVVAVNSTLQRARRSLATRPPAEEPHTATEPDQTAADRRRLLDHYVDALERQDSAAFVTLLRAEQATLSAAR